MKILVAVLALSLAACTGEMTSRLSKPETLAAAIEIINAYNAAGVDPVKLNEKELAVLRTTCVTFALLSALVSPPETTPEENVAVAENLCQIASKVAE